MNKTNILQSIAEYKNKISNNLDPLRSEFLLNVGELYRQANDFQNMEKYLLEAGQGGNIKAISKLELYYIIVGKNDLAYELFTKEMKKGKQSTICHLLSEINQVNLKTFLLDYYSFKAISADMEAVYFLGQYFKIIKDYDSMLQYFLTGVEHGHSNCMYSLGVYYRFINDFENAAKYYKMAVDLKMI